MSIVIKVFEGLGDYKGIAVDTDFHPNGRCGAKVEAYLDDELVYETYNASTLADSISSDYADKYNNERAIPTIFEGEYNAYTTLHLSNYKALEFEKGSQTVPVIRNKKESTSTAINFHYRKDVNDPISYAISTGCVTVLDDDLYEMFYALGISNFNGQYIGKIIIDRSNVSKYHKELYNLYDEYYGEGMSDLFTEITEEDEASEWAKESWEWAIETGLTDGTDPQETLTREQFAVMLKRFYDQLTITV